MIDWKKTARAGLLLACAAGVSGIGANAAADAQLANGQVRSRGVMVIRPTATPTPTPVASPIPAPAPKPEPVKVARPEPVKPAPAPMPTSIIKPCPRPFARPDVSLDGSAAFNRRLRALLAARRSSVVVDLPAPYVVDTAPPAPLTPWIGQVKSSGGLVRVDSYCQANRGMFGFLRKMFSPSADPKPYAAADGYDAVLHLDGSDQRVTQVEFALRSAK